MKRLLLSLALLLTIGVGCAFASTPVDASRTVVAQAARTSMSPTVPASVAANDVLVAYIFSDTPGGVTVAMTGFTQKSHITTFTPDHEEWLFWKRATGADSGTYSITWGGASKAFGCVVVRLTGAVLSGDPFDAAGVVTATNVTSNSTLPTATLTGTSTNSLAFAAFGLFSSGTLTMTGWTLDYAGAAGVSEFALANHDDTAGGNLTTGAATWSVADAEKIVLAFAIDGIAVAGGCTAPPNQLMMLGVGNCKGVE